MRHFGFKRRTPRRRTGNVVIHVPATIAGSATVNTAIAIVIESPSILAAGSASSNIEAQDKDRTVNVGHHIGRINIDISFHNIINDGIVEFCVFKVERADSTPVVGTHPVPSTAEVLTQGMQQACRMANPGKVFHFSQRAYVIEQPITHKIIVSPAKYKLSKIKAGDHWMLLIFNRGSQAITFNYQCRYKEYE